MRDIVALLHCLNPHLQATTVGQLSRIIDQGGIPLSKRVAVTLAKAPYGGGGVVVEFAKW